MASSLEGQQSKQVGWSRRRIIITAAAFILLFLVLFYFYAITRPPEKIIAVKYFYSETCGFAAEATPVMDKVKETFGDAVDLQKKCIVVHEGDDKLCIDKYGEDEFQSAMQEAQAFGVQGTPTIYVDGVMYLGLRDEISFTKFLCSKLPNHPACRNLPECVWNQDCIKPGKVGRCFNPRKENAYCEFTDPVKLPFTVLNDRNCKSCDTSLIISIVRRIFPGAMVEEVDYNTDEGKKLAEDLNIKALPAYIFDKTVTETPEYVGLQKTLIKVPDDKYIIDKEAIISYYNLTFIEIQEEEVTSGPY